VVSDIDGDGKLEIVVATRSRGVFAWEPTYNSSVDRFICEPELAWPFRIMEEPTTPVIADIDNDGCLELLVGDQTGEIHALSLPGACVASAPWSMEGGNAQRTHRYQSQLGGSPGTEKSIEGVTSVTVGPNPASMAMFLRFQMAHRGQASVEIFDVSGRSVKRLFDGPAAAGLTELMWDERNARGELVGSGTYYIRFRLGNQELTRTAVVVR
jgi:hypothetical protein